MSKQTIQSTFSEFFLPQEQLNLEEDKKDGLIWKTILRTGEWKIRPNKNGTGDKRSLKILKNDADYDKGEIALKDLKEAFDNGAFEYVTIPETHSDKAIENTGFIRKLEVIDGEDGVTRLRAGHDFTEPDVKQKVVNGSIAGNSAGIYTGYQRKEDGKVFPAALAHSALTNRPWINGMGTFASSDEIDEKEIISAQLIGDDSLKFESDIIWEDKKAFNFIRDQISSQLKEIRKTDDPEDSVNSYDVLDVSKNKALVKDFEMNNTYVVPFKSSGKGVNISPPEQWVFAKQTYVKASEETEEKETKEDKTSAETPSVALSVENKPASPPLQSTPENELGESQRKRNLLLLEHDKKNSRKIGGKRMAGATTVDMDKLELSDEARELIEHQQTELAENKEELAKVKADNQKHEVESKIENLKKIGLDQYPGLLKFIRNVYLSDDGGTAILLSEEENGKESKSKLTSTQIVDGFVEALPKEDGKIKLSEQILEIDNDNKPEDDTSKEVPQEEKTAKAAEFLGVPNPYEKNKEG